jgi:hypothetical protein
MRIENKTVSRERRDEEEQENLFLPKTSRVARRIEMKSKQLCEEAGFELKGQR